MAFLCSFLQMKTKERLQRTRLTEVKLIPREPSRERREVVQWDPCVQGPFFLFFWPIFYLALFVP